MTKPLCVFSTSFFHGKESDFNRKKLFGGGFVKGNGIEKQITLYAKYTK